jgi:hypothetical protein
VWKRVLQVVEGFHVEVWESMWNRVLRIVESFNIDVWGVCKRSFSSCWNLQVSSVSKRVLCQCYKFQVKFQVCARKFFKCLRISCKDFVLWHIAIEWERFQVKFSNISKFFNLKFFHLHFIWIQKHRVFMLAFVFKKMSSFQMSSLKVMEKFDGGNFHLWKFNGKCCIAQQNS